VDDGESSFIKRDPSILKLLERGDDVSDEKDQMQ
jgi:hypothetical protein